MPEASGAPGEGEDRNDRTDPRVPRRPRNVRLPDGVFDHPPASAHAILSRQNAIAYVFDLHGYREVLTPMFELLETLEVGLGETARRSAFRLVDPASGEVSVLRPDFTAQVARMVAARMSGTERPLRLAYQGRIARAQDPLGRGLSSREVFQAGIELIGGGGPPSDLEVLSIGAECFRALGRGATIDLGHSAIVPALTGVSDPAIARALAAKDPVRVAALAPALAPLVDLYGSTDVIARARRVLPSAVAPMLDELEQLAHGLSAAHPELAITIDLGEQRSLGYYSGVFFAGYVEGASDAVMAGGRYDHLLERFGDPEPAVGLALDVGALIGHAPPAPRRRGVVVTEGLEGEARRRRRRGERTVVVPRLEARAYAVAHLFRAIVDRDPATGRIVEEAIAEE
jgi:ATP phosphoribosyltransferase regulatory subunit